jgi:hypothetical protein
MISCASTPSCFANAEIMIGSSAILLRRYKFIVFI